MPEALLYFILKQLPVIAVTAILFSLFGWWLRARLHKCSTTKEQVEAERPKIKTSDTRIKEALARAKLAEDSLAKVKEDARNEVAQKLADMVPASALAKAQAEADKERRNAKALQGQVQRSVDNEKALRKLETKNFELQGEISKAREEKLRLTSSVAAAPAVSAEAEVARMKETMRAAESHAGQQRRRGDELEAKVNLLTEKLEKARTDAGIVKVKAPSAAEIAAADHLESELAKANATIQALEGALTMEKRRGSSLDRELANIKTQFIQFKGAAQASTAVTERTTARVEPNDPPSTQELPRLQADPDTNHAEALRIEATDADTGISDGAGSFPTSAEVATSGAALDSTDPAGDERASLSTPVVETSSAPQSPDSTLDLPSPELVLGVPTAVEKVVRISEEDSSNEAAPSIGEVKHSKTKLPIASDTLGKRVVQDDLKIVEGIGPKIEELLQADGISTWHTLGEAGVETLQGILTRAGERFAMHDPTTWPAQSKLANEGKWTELRALQDALDGGRIAAISTESPATPEE